MYFDPTIRADLSRPRGHGSGDRNNSPADELGAMEFMLGPGLPPPRPIGRCDYNNRLVLPLIQLAKQSISVESHLALLPENVHVQDGPIIAETPLYSIPFKDFQLNSIEEAYRLQQQAPEQSHPVDLLPLRNYLVGKQKGRDGLSTAFSILSASSDTQKVQYYLQINNNLLRKLARTLGDPSISAQLKIEGFGFDQPQHQHQHQMFYDPFATASPSPPNVPSGQYLFCTDGTYRILELLKTSPGVPALIKIDPSPVRSSHSHGIIHGPEFVVYHGHHGMRVSHSRCTHHMNMNAEITRQLLQRVRTGSMTFTLTIIIESINKPVVKGPIKLNTDGILQNMYNLENATKEIVIVAANGAELKCHKNILTSQSASFHSMLNTEHGMTEARTGRIEMPLNSEEGLYQFIRCLYGFEIPVATITPDIALEVFQLANKYEVQELESFLKEFLCEKGMSWYSPDTILELYFYVRNVESLEELRTHAMTEASTLSEEVLKSCDYYKKLSQEDALSFVFKLLEWK